MIRLSQTASPRFVVLLAGLALLVGACGGPQVTETGGIAPLRGQWDASELPAPGPVDATPVVARDLPVPRAIVHALELDAAGFPVEALDALLHGAPPRDALESFAQTIFVYRYLTTVPGFGERAQAWLDAPRADLHPAERLLRNEMRATIAWREHRWAVETAPFDRARYGSATSWRVIGPLSDHELVDRNDDRHWLDMAQLPDGFRGDGGRALHPRELVESGEGIAVPGAGVWVAEAFVEVGAPTEAVLAISGPRWSTVRIGDGDPLLTVGLEDEWGPRFGMQRVQLSAGTHRIRVTLGSSDSQGGFLLRLVPLDDETTFNSFNARTDTTLVPDGATAIGEGPPQTFSGTWSTGFRRAPDDAVYRLVLGRAASLDNDANRMRAITRDQDDTHPVLASQHADLVLRTRSLSRSARNAEATERLRASLDAHPEMAGVALSLAVLLHREDRLDDALAIVQEVAAVRPDHPEVHRRLGDLFYDQGWEEEARLAWQRASVLFPEHCGLVGELVRQAVQRMEPFTLEAVPEHWLWCDRTWDTHASRVLRPAGELTRALELARQSSRRNVESRTWAERWIDVAAGLRHEGAIEEALSFASRSAWSPRDIAGVRADLALRDGRSAEEHWDEALAYTPDDVALRVQRDFLRGDRLLSQWRRDGFAAIDAWRESGRQYDGGIAFILDHMHEAFFEDGSSLRVTHQIVQVITRDALNQVGEIGLPRGATLLTVRTIKPDGRTLVPEDHPDKDAIGLPELEVGDLIEFEYVERRSPGVHLRNVGVSERFYFRTPAVSMHESTYVLEYPDSWAGAVQIDRIAFDGEETEAEADGRRIHRFTMHQVEPPEPDPNAVSPQEWLPSVRFAHRLELDDLRRIHANRIARAIAPDESLRAKARELREEHGQGRRLLRAIFATVMDDFLDGGGWFSEPAAHGWALGNGDRNAVMLALLEAAGFSPQVVFISSFGNPEIDPVVPDMGLYDFTAIRVEVGERDFWLDAGMDFNTFHWLPADVQARPAIVVYGPNAGETLTSPWWPLEHHQDAMTYEIEVRADGTVRGTATERMSRRTAPGIRGWLEYVESREDLMLDLERGLAGSFRDGRITSVEIEGEDEREEPLVLTFEFEGRVHIERTAEGTRLLDVDLMPRRIGRNLADRPERQRAMNVRRAIFENLEVTWTLPEGWEVLRSPDDIDIAAGPGSFSYTHDINGRTIRSSRELLLPVHRIEPEDYADFARFVQGVEDGTRTTFTLRAPEGLAAAGE